MTIAKALLIPLVGLLMVVVGVSLLSQVAADEEPIVVDIYPTKVKAGEDVTVVFTIQNISLDDVVSTRVHWDTESKGEPLNYANYANSVNAQEISPPSEGQYTATFTAPSDAENVYFVVYVSADGTHYYAEDTEFKIKVEKEESDSISTTTLAIIGIVVLLVIILIVFLAMGRKSDG